VNNNDLPSVEHSIYHVDSVEPGEPGSKGLVLGLVPPGSRVLDIGCSTGALSAAMQKQGCDVTGLDISASDLARATARVRRVVQADIEVEDLVDLFPGETFDVVVAADVLEHLRDPDRVLQMARAVLAPSGFVVFSIPNVAHASVRLALWNGSFPYGPHGILDRTHLRMFTRSSVEDLFVGNAYSLDELHRTEIPLASGVPHQRGQVPRRLIRGMLKEPEALTLQFVGIARPVGPPPVLPLRPTRTPKNKDQILIAEQAALISQQAAALAHQGESLAALLDYWRANEVPLHARLKRRVRRVLGRAVRAVPIRPSSRWHR
jgi:SAM-dependent methyltransferase